jgi:hypothetical protein
MRLFRYMAQMFNKNKGMCYIKGSLNLDRIQYFRSLLLKRHHPIVPYNMAIGKQLQGADNTAASRHI